MSNQEANMNTSTNTRPLQLQMQKLNTTTKTNTPNISMTLRYGKGGQRFSKYTNIRCKNTRLFDRTTPLFYNGWQQQQQRWCFTCLKEQMEAFV